MSSSVGGAGGARCLDLNRDTAAVVDNLEAGIEEELEDALVSTGGDVLDMKVGETMDAEGDEKNACGIGVTYWEDEMVGNEEGNIGSVHGRVHKDDADGLVIREAGVELHSGKILELDFGMKGSSELVSVSTLGCEDVDANTQTLDFGVGPGGDQKLGANIDKRGVVETVKVCLDALVGAVGIEEEKLERSSSISRSEQIEVQVDLIDRGGKLLDGQLGLEEKNPKSESMRLSELGSTTNEISDLVPVSDEKFEAVEVSNEGVNVDISGGDQEIAIDVDSGGMIIDCQLDPGGRDVEVMSDDRRLLEVERGDEESTELVSVSTERFESVEGSSHSIDVLDGSGGDQNQGSNLYAELNLGEKGSVVMIPVSEERIQVRYLGDESHDQSQGIDANVEDAVRTEEVSLAASVCGGGAEGERLVQSSFLREEKVEMHLEDGDAKAMEYQLCSVEREAEGQSLGVKLFVMDAGRTESVDLVAVSVKEYEAAEASNQASCYQKQGFEFDAENTFVDGQFGKEAMDAEGIQPAKACCHPMDFFGESGIDQKKRSDLNAEGMLVDDDLGSGKEVVNVRFHGGELLEMNSGEVGSADLVSVSTERFEFDKACRHFMDLGNDSCDDQRPEKALDTEGMAGINEDNVAVSLGCGRNVLKVGCKEKSTVLVACSIEGFESVKALSQTVNSVHISGDDQKLLIDANVEGMVRNDSSVTFFDQEPENERLEVSLVLRKEKVEVSNHVGGDRSQVVDGELVTGKREDKFKSFSGSVCMGVEGCVVKDSGELSEAVEASSQTKMFGDESGGDQKRGAGVDMEDLIGTEVSLVGLVVDEQSSMLRRVQFEVQVDLVDGCDQSVGGQICCKERETEIDSHVGMLLELDAGDKESADLIAASVVEFEAIEASNLAMNSSDHKRGTDVNEEGMAMDTELSFVNGEAEVKSVGRKFLEVDRDEEGSAELSAVSAEGFAPVKTSSDPMDLIDGSGADHRVETEVDAVAMARMDNDLVAISFVSEALDGYGEAVEGELGTVISESKVKSSGERCVDEDIGDMGKTGQVAAFTVQSEAVGPRNQAMDLGYALGSDQKLGTDTKVEGMAGNEDSVTVSVVDIANVEDSRQAFETGEISVVDQMEVVDANAKDMVVIDDDSAAVLTGGGAPVNERMVESSFLGSVNVEVLRKSVDGCALVSHSELILGVSKSVAEISEKSLKVKSEEEGGVELFAISTEGFEAAVPCIQAIDFEHGSGGDLKQGTNVDAENLLGTTGDSVSASGTDEGPEVDGLENSSFLGKHTEILHDVVDTHDQVLDGEFGLEKREAEAVTDGEKLLEVCREEGIAELASTPAGGSCSFEYSTQKMDLEDRSSSEKTQETNADAVCSARTDEASVVASVRGGTKHEMLEGSSNLPKEKAEVGSNLGSDGSQTMVEVAHSQKRCGSVNVDAVCALFEGHPHEREGEIVGDISNSQSKLNSEFSAGKENMIEKGLACLPVRVEAVNDFTDHALDDGDSSGDVCDQKGLGLSADDGDPSGIDHHFTVSSELADVHTPESEYDQKVYGEHSAVDNMAQRENSVISVTAAESQNGGERLNFDNKNQQKDLSSTSVSCKKEDVHVGGPLLVGNIYTEKGLGIVEEFDSSSGINIHNPSLVSLIVSPPLNEPSVGSQDMRSPNVSSMEHEELDRIESVSTSQQATYYLSFHEKENFSTSDLVWGKVKSHPWWPGQIFDISGASELARKYQKKDHFLVAYFGDKTFAWCEESCLKPFPLHFSQMEKQTSSDAFLRAVRDILFEISRRVELSLTCSCLPEETYADIKYQKVENAGVRGKTANSVFERCEFVDYFDPDKLLEYVRALSQLPNGGADRLELTVAQAQLKAFYLSKGYTELPSFTNGSGLVENDIKIPFSSQNLNDVDLDHSATLSDMFSAKGKSRNRDGALSKKKNIVEDGKKHKSLSELMGENKNSIVNRCEHASEVLNNQIILSPGNKRKAFDIISADSTRIKAKKIDEETKLPSPTSNSSFKVGEFVSRAATKLTSGQTIRKCYGETSERCFSKTDDMSIDFMDIDVFLDVPFKNPNLQIDISVKYPLAKEMLSKLCSAAKNPMKGYSFSSIVVHFFSTFRNARISNLFVEKNLTEKPRAKRGRKKKIISDLESPDMSTPDHMKDSYWSDMVLPEKDVILYPPKRRGRKKKKFFDESSPLPMLTSPSDCEQKLHTLTMCPHVKHILIAERSIISVEEKIVDERMPTSMILYFNNSNSLPSDTDLIRIFSRFGPLKEEETCIERKDNSAMVVFKKRADAEMAFSSAGKFSSFGPSLLSYRLRRFPCNSTPLNTAEFNGVSDANLCEAVGEKASIFLQSQEYCEPVSNMPSVEFPELAQRQVGDEADLDSAPAYIERKEQSQDDPVKRKEPSQADLVEMDTTAVSDHVFLGPSYQKLPFFYLDHADPVDASDFSGTEVQHGMCYGSHLDKPETTEQSCGPADQLVKAATEHLENERVLETSEAGEKECSGSLPAHLVTGASDESSITVDVPLMEVDSCAVKLQKE